MLQSRSIRYLVLGIVALVLATPVFAGGQQEATGAETTTETADGAWEPTGPVEFVVHNSAGSGTDAFIRTVAQALTEGGIVPVDINVVNRPGAGGRTARLYLADQEGKCDVLAGATQSWITRGAINPDDLDHTNFTPVAHLAGSPVALLVGADDDRFDTLDEFVEYARERPGEVSQGGPDVGSGEWLATKMLEDETGIQINYVSFQEGGNVMPSILGGHVDFVFGNPGEVAQYVEAGDLKFLAVMMLERLDSFPEIPTFKELGYGDLEYFAPRGFYGPPNMPDECREYWEKAFEQALQTDIMQNWLANTGNSAIYRNGDAYVQFIENFQNSTIPILDREGLLD